MDLNFVSVCKNVKKRTQPISSLLDLALGLGQKRIYRYLINRIKKAIKLCLLT